MPNDDTPEEKAKLVQGALDRDLEERLKAACDLLERVLLAVEGDGPGFGLYRRPGTLSSGHEIPEGVRATCSFRGADGDITYAYGTSLYDAVKKMQEEKALCRSKSSKKN
jgi:hypothetical protein